MTVWQAWLAANRPLIYFVYGQVFFVLGLAILMQSRRYSRLALARHLRWLAAFGLIHSLNEWGEVFIPLQAAGLGETWAAWLRAAQTIVLAASFVCLAQFGVELGQPFPARWRWVRLVPAGAGLVWLLGPLGLGGRWLPNLADWHATAEALARYGLGFPGGLLAAYALWRQTQTRIAAVGGAHICAMLRLASLALAVYAGLGGLIVPPAPFFPANVFNSQGLSDWLILPPPVLRSLTGLVLAITIIRALEVFEVETDRLIERLEQAQVLAVERERLSRDLHDGAIQRVYAAGLLAQALRAKAAGPLAEGLERLLLTLNEAIGDLRSFLTDLHPTETPVDLNAGLETVVQEARRTASGTVIYSGPGPDWPRLSADRVAHLVAFTREALSNAVRHAHAQTIEVKISRVGPELWVLVRDDGRGMPETPVAGYGLRHMRDRARLVGGGVTFDSKPGQGVTVKLTVPVEPEA